MKQSRIFLSCFVVLLALALQLTELAHWKKIDLYSPSGDEPHYLIMASALIKNGSLEQSQAYDEEVQNKEIYKKGLSEQDKTTHIIKGPHGAFNIHNIGLPLLISIPYAIGGVWGTKVFMVFIASIVILLQWKISGLTGSNPTSRLLSVLAVGFCPPLIAGGTQIYPDILAGLLTLYPIYFLSSPNRKSFGLHHLGTLLSITLLPWLQIKYAAASAILFFAAVRKELQSGDRLKSSIFMMGWIISIACLAAYNTYAFGKASGPYGHGALELSITSLMVFFGLLLDQNQGFLMQNPINFIGLLYVVPFIRQDPNRGFIWLLVLASLLLPNAMHPAWYGGWSFAGRFGWSFWIVFSIVSLYGMTEIYRKRQLAFYCIATTGIVLQAYHYVRYLTAQINLYYRGTEIWSDGYSIFYSLISDWLPMLYNRSWAFDFHPNYAWAFLIFTCLATTAIRERNRISIAAFITSGILIAISGIHPGGRDQIKIYAASELPATTGRTEGNTRIAESKLDQSGFINFGPRVPLKTGKFQVILDYDSKDSEGMAPGYFDVLDAKTMTVISKAEIPPSDGKNSSLFIDLNTSHSEPHPYEFRTFWKGEGVLRVNRISLKRAGAD